MLPYAAAIVFAGFLLCGLAALGVALFHWRWFFSTSGGRAMQRAFGRRGVRIFYFLLGCFILYMAYLVCRDYCLLAFLAD